MVSEETNIHRIKVKINIKGISQHSVITLCAKNFIGKRNTFIGRRKEKGKKEKKKKIVYHRNNSNRG